MGGRGSSSGMGSRNLRNAENRIRNDSVETAVLIGPNGDILLDKSDGMEASVNFTPKETALMKNGVLTHNHPSGSTFSEADIDLAFTHGVKEIRVVHTNGSYSLTRQYNIGDDIPFRYEDFAYNYERAVQSYMRSTVNAIYNKTGDADRCNGMVADYRRQWLTQNASNYGWKYKESKR